MQNLAIQKVNKDCIKYLISTMQSKQESLTLKKSKEYAEN